VFQVTCTSTKPQKSVEINSMQEAVKSFVAVTRHSRRSVLLSATSTLNVTELKRKGKS